jgi:hypothetical protein
MPFPLIAVDTSNDRALSELSDWDTVRAQFNLAPKKIDMSCYWQASHPKPVRDATLLTGAQSHRATLAIHAKEWHSQPLLRQPSRAGGNVDSSVWRDAVLSGSHPPFSSSLFLVIMSFYLC